MGIGKSYKKLTVWVKADDFALSVYNMTRLFPKEEIYGITSQLRRASLSVPVNIVEGHARQGKAELRQFLRIAIASLSEVEYLLEFCTKLGYLSSDKYYIIEKKREEVGRMLWGFYKAQF
ncbi:MAG: four helix bundle protein [Candidatus Firestonebacteria bacterium GWA2_43_8]|nr:MAG: four helix bundle protein [Candidatus Firestonebacteria bacterium GWA2_43_8]